MFARWGLAMVRARWAVLAAALLVVVLGATWGAGVFGALSTGGFNDANSESAKVRAQIIAELGPQDADVIALYSSATATVDDPGFRTAVTAALARVAARPEVAGVLNWYQTPVPALLSTDKHATYAVVRRRAGADDQKLKDYRAIKGLFPAGAGISTQFGGTRPFYDDANETTTSDIARAETMSMPVLLVLLVLIFGSVVAAATPLVVGGLSILGAFIVTRVLSQLTDVSTFAINIITLIGLGLSIDYALFVVSRFREELAAGKDTRAAVAATMATAGRTVAVSGVTVTLALASLLLFPQVFLRSMGYGGMAAVLVAMLASLTVLPALLAVLGPRVNALRIPLPWSRWASRRRLAADVTVGTPQGGWARLARSVMRRPWLYLVGVLAVLGVLAGPVTHIAFGGVDARVLPVSAQSRATSDRIHAEFPATTTYPVQVLATGVTGAAATELAGHLATLPGVAGATVVAASGDSALINVAYPGDDATSAGARALVGELRGYAAPAGVTLGVTGATADLVDQLDGLGAALPWMLLFVVAVTLVLLFLAFGSVVLPVKAVLMNVVSLGAAFGAVVFIFQDGHFASWLGFTPTGYIEPTNPILMIAVLFGLATDYEVFLLSRIREEWDRSVAAGRSDGVANTAAVAAGVQRTGRIITSAALLLIVVVIGFASGDIGFVKLIGVGMVVAILVDATLVRALLVPATMRLLGRWNWWAPGPLARFYRRYGISEAEPVELLVPAGAAAAGDRPAQAAGVR